VCDRERENVCEGERKGESVCVRLCEGEREKRKRDAEERERETERSMSMSMRVRLSEH
jgi:hypothetical protein